MREEGFYQHDEANVEFVIRPDTDCYVCGTPIIYEGEPEAGGKWRHVTLENEDHQATPEATSLTLEDLDDGWEPMP